MLLVQSYHSIHEIDAEFIPNIELLLKEDIPSFNTLQLRHDEAPASDVFSYFLFFGPTQNTPVGFASVTLRKIPYENYLPWWRKLLFWKKDHHHWQQAIWKIADGSAGHYVFDSRFVRSGREKIQSLMQDYEKRAEVMAQYTYSIKGLQELSSRNNTQDLYVLEPLLRSSKSYQEYLTNLSPQMQNQIKQNWKSLHQSGEVVMGDYASIGNVQKSLQLAPALQERLYKQKAQILTFEKDKSLLGCLSVLKGKDGNIFFEPYPFEPVNGSLVSDDLYIQYALLKFFEMPEARRCHILKDGEKLLFKNKEELASFTDQGFQLKTISTNFSSRLKGMSHPV